MASEGLLPHVDVGSGSPVVLLHGFALDGRVWASQLKSLQRRHRVLVPDLPGFGPDGATAGAFGPAEEVYRLLSTKGLGPACLVGLSYGGAVAVDLLLSHKEAVHSLVLIDALLLGERAGIDGWSTCAERAKRGDLDGARETYLGTKLFEQLRSHPEAWKRLEEMVRVYPCGHWRGSLETTWKQPEPKALLTDIRCPALVLVGELDFPGFRDMSHRYATSIEGARLEVLTGLGHMLPMEAPERLNGLLLDFLGTEAPALPSSPRLDFRTWRPGEVEMGMQLWGDAAVTSYITAKPFTRTQVEDRLRQEVERQEEHGVQYGPIFLRANGELVGCCGFRPRASPEGVLELGFLLRPPFWRQGLATEAAGAAVAHAFEVLGATAIFAGHHPENSASRHVLEKLGFRRTHVEHYPPTGLDQPSYLLTRDAFREAHSTR
jgi:[ribosomal protein S5]-alanine N-acetyltransferase